jgi:hypothetical protein
MITIAREAAANYHNSAVCQAQRDRDFQMFSSRRLVLGWYDEFGTVANFERRLCCLQIKPRKQSDGVVVLRTAGIRAGKISRR